MLVLGPILRGTCWWPEVFDVKVCIKTLALDAVELRQMRRHREAGALISDKRRHNTNGACVSHTLKHIFGCRAVSCARKHSAGADAQSNSTRVVGDHV